jgi:hypothetical protein
VRADQRPESRLLSGFVFAKLTLGALRALDGEFVIHRKEGGSFHATWTVELVGEPNEEGL